MIRYELNDKKRQAALEKVFPGFGRALQVACKNEFDDEFSHVCVQLNLDGDVFYDDEVCVKKSAIRAKRAYDPHAWNDYPNVTPPEGVLMRIEGQYAKRPELEYYGALMYLEGAWHFADTVEIADNVIVERFRPWNDEEAAK